jgi:hypothetical protein
MQADHAEQKSEIQAERVQKEYDGPQAPSYTDTNLGIGSRQSPMHPTNHPWLFFQYLNLCPAGLCI